MDAAMRVAVVDIGTNSTRLLIADVDGGRVSEVERRTTVTNMGRGVDHTSTICSDAIEDVCGVIADYKARYEELGAERVLAIATSAVRDAANGEAFVAELRERFGLNARLLTSEEEAHLTYLGATAHRSADERTLVFDIGGGSTELIVGSGHEVGFYISLQAGTIRQSERHLTSDPPEARRRDSQPDRARRSRAARGQTHPGDRSSRHPDLARGDRPAARALRPGPGTRLPARDAAHPADAQPPLLPPAG
jgi:exopolyphosphatase / guanosine-5'-triphosphate,3'-diphosphate pyrophosphatase